jgi:AhpD family alkylhydroperoxidase
MMELDDTYHKLRRLSPKVTGSLVRMRSETFQDTAVPGKYKLLAALAVVVATKCEPCIKGYTKLAVEAGATQSELVEFLNVAITESGCPGEQWAMIALGTYADLETGKSVDTDICCNEEDAK